MYLTQFRFNTARRGAQELLRTRHKLHGAVMKSFADLGGYSPGDGPRILWRLDRDGDDCLLYIASPLRPDLTHLEEQAGWPTTPNWRTANYSLLLDRLEDGQRWGFRLAANPTHSVVVPARPGREVRVNAEGRERSQRVGHVTVAQQEQWLLQRQETIGVSLMADSEQTFRVTRRDLATFERREKPAADGGAGDTKPGRNKVTLTIAQYDGVLEVTDPNLLRSALVRGIGPAKGYGCGMLTLAPV